jgi:hypothetical protein
MSGAKKAIWAAAAISVILVVGFLAYHLNKPITEAGRLGDDFEDQVPGTFPAGWWSGVNAHNARVRDLGGNLALEVLDDDGDDVTEVMKKFTKSSEGSFSCRLLIDDPEGGFVLHLPQRDSDYNPYDDIVVVFLNRGVYVAGEGDIVEFEYEGEIVQLIDEWGLAGRSPLETYRAGSWMDVELDFDLESFSLEVNGTDTGAHSYPRYSPSYICSVYVWTLIEPAGFSVYVDDVDIRIAEMVDPMHPLNLALLIAFFVAEAALAATYFALLRGGDGKLF